MIHIRAGTVSAPSRDRAGRAAATARASLRRVAPAIALAIALGLAPACRREESNPATRPTATSHPIATSRATGPALVDITAPAGITFVHDAVRHGRFLFPEINGAGCAMLDYDNDGRLDLYLIQSAIDLSTGKPNKPNTLYHNRGDGTFEDVTERANAGCLGVGFGQGVACGDYDNDGFVDIYVANVGGPDVLLHNNGDGTFTNVTAAVGIDNPEYAIAPAFLDYDNDGWLDIYVGNYVRWSLDRDIECYVKGVGIRDYCGPSNYTPARDCLFHNRGDGTFEDVSVRAGLDAAIGPTMSTICADVNDDGWIDIYAANDQWANQLWINQRNGTFKDCAFQLGAALSDAGMAESSMGTNAEDLDGDGDLDLWLNNFAVEGGTVYINENGFFVDKSNITGLSSMTRAHTAFGAVVFDLRNDGGYYVYVGNGKAVRAGIKTVEGDAHEPYAESDQVIHYDRRKQRFEDITKDMGPALEYQAISRGTARGDIDNDGDEDILILDNNGPARLLRNDAANQSGNHWITIRCIGPDGRRDHLGAKVYVTAGGATRRRDVIVAHSYCSASDPRLHFGVGANTRIEEVRVRWLDGTDTVLEDVPVDQFLTVRHPKAAKP